jgi:hypothetical protein
VNTKKIIYVGIDVDDNAFHGAGLCFETGEMAQFKCKPELIESCQLALNPPILSKRLRKLREGQPQVVIDIADRCMNRLHKKSTRMLYAGKHKNKIKIAPARAA